MKTKTRQAGRVAAHGQGPSLRFMYDLLNGHFGDLHWWPAVSSFEVIVGAILTQNTAWRNVESAIGNLRDQDMLSPGRILEAEDDRIAALIRPSGYFNVKTRRLKAFVQYLFDEHDGSLETMFRQDVWTLRTSLLHVRGIGRETADSILLYAGDKPVFVVDAYTQRILERHGLIEDDTGYDDIQSLFMKHLPPKVDIYNQYHALFVHAGKSYCRKKNPRCDACPLQTLFTKTPGP